MSSEHCSRPNPSGDPAEVLIRVDSAYKVFGRKADKALALLKKGKTREEVEEKTGAVCAVIDASFEVRRGEIFVIMGLSGSGKSTLVRMINLLHPPTAGKIEFDGVDLSKLDTSELRRVRAEKMSMVFQHFGLFPHRTNVENASWGLEVLRVPKEERRQRAAHALQLVGLEGWEDSYPSELSGGMQQRVGLARALATDADVLLMDEAFSALDPLIRREMQEQLIELQRDLGKTIVFITHDLNEAMLLGDRIAVMKHGEIVQIGTSEEILQAPANDYVEAFVKDVDRSRVLTASSVMEEPNGEEIPADEAQTVAPDTVLSEMLMSSAESDYPLQVVEDGELVGVVPSDAILSALAWQSSTADDVREADSSTQGTAGGEEAEPSTLKADCDSGRQKEVGSGLQ